LGKLFFEDCLKALSSLRFSYWQLPNDT